MQIGTSEDFASLAGDAGWEVQMAGSLPPPILAAGTSDLVVVATDEAMNGKDWPVWRARLHHAHRRFLVAGKNLPVPVVVEAMRDGAHDCLDLAGAGPAQVGAALEGAARAQSAWLDLYGVPESTGTASGPVGASPAFLSLMETIRRVGPTPSSVLLLGETGTGKEEMARALHACRPAGPFVALNCAAIPRELLESELFGVVAGAFTGARVDRPGLVEQAAGGTLFLDEVSEMDLSLQPKLLRFLETRVARRVGGKADYKVDLRVLSAGNRLHDPSGTAGLREDLFYRLAEFQINIPPLRERQEDILVLARHFLGQASERFGKYFDQLDDGLVDALRAHSWPGNARELRHVIDRLAVLQDGPILRARGWEPARRSFSTPPPATPATPASPPVAAPSPPSPPAGLPAATPALPMGPPGPFSRLPKSARKEEARRLLVESGGDLAWTAQAMGVHPATFYRWRKKWGWLEAPPVPTAPHP